MQAIAETPHERPKPVVSFHMEKKVGDATLTVYGSDGQEKEAKEAIDRAAKKFRGGVDTDE
jgi:ribosomal protein L16/L10AE